MFVAVYSVRSGTVTDIVMMALGSYICHEAGPAVGERGEVRMGGSSVVAENSCPLCFLSCHPPRLSPSCQKDDAVCHLTDSTQQTEYSFNIYRLRHVSTLFSSIGPVVKSL